MAEKDKSGENEGGFLGRWSRRKRRAKTGHDEPLLEDAEAASGKPGKDVPETEPEETDEEKANREAAEAVDIDELSYESDFSIFMKSGVPEFLRRKAMRKLWSTNPVLANLDGLNDYDEDYADAKFNVFKSAWNVVGGYVGKEEADQRNAEIEEAAEPARTGNNQKGAGTPVAPSQEAEKSPSQEEMEAGGGGGKDPPKQGPDREEGISRVSLRKRLKG